MQKKYDIVATVGTYTKNGEIKKKYKNVGVVMVKEGDPFILLDKTFNPAGMPGDKDTVLLSLFTPKEDNAAHTQSTQLNDEIPFN